MIPVNCRSRQQYLSELPKSFQQQELTFLLTLAFTATKILSTVGVDIYRLQLLDLPTAWKTLCFPSTIEVENVAFRATLKRKTLCFCQLTQLTTIASRATKILSILRTGISAASELPNTWKTLYYLSSISVDKCNFQSYQKPSA